ncbi:YrbL family protein [Aliihoeflea sp. 40Bstr573]|uniref:YrbL family protein n=1 Tax=Aliihoeflea sp. 40Bstr573 TaxID=2696467 RepID=UPI00209444D9|nr:YrbL family protein [Aliihoeflea sp. 40Bstr573]MCO6386977.1 hypothetical protein [Aliihoeflea sp. 40Bstr573]
MGRPFLELSDRTPVCFGDTRQIYEVSDYPGSLVRTIRPERVDAFGHLVGKNGMKRLRMAGCYQGFARELAEYLIQSRRLHTQPGFLLPFAHIYGLVQTDMGTGLVMEKIVGEDGELAPTIGHLHAEGRLTDKHQAALEAMFERCRGLHIVLSDIHANNIVYTEERSGRPECVSVDGFGERVFIPIHRWFASVNRRKINRIARDAAASLRRPPAQERWGRH